MAYDTIAENSTLYPGVFYAFYIGQNNNGICHLIFRISTKQILTTMKYKQVLVPENLPQTINEKDTLTTKIQIDWFDSDRSIGQDNHINFTKDDDQTWSNEVGNSVDESHDELNIPQQLGCMESNTMFHQENQIILTVGSSKYTRVSMIKMNGIISKSSKFLQGLFLQ